MEWTSFNAGPSAVEALFAGAIDVTYVGPNPAVNGYVRSNGEALRVVAGAARGADRRKARAGSQHGTDPHLPGTWIVSLAHSRPERRVRDEDEGHPRGGARGKGAVLGVLFGAWALLAKLQIWPPYLFPTPWSVWDEL
jgi:ABC-type nitrate/sulfonate/bicarbonate transport system substrate-binding protein